MARIDTKQLADSLKRRQLSNLYYFYGSDTMAVEQCVKSVLRIASDGDETAVTKIDGTNPDVSQLADEAELCPMFSDYNCIWVHDLNMETQREDVRKAILEILKNVSPQTILVFDVTGFDIFGGKTGKNKKPTDKNQKIIGYIAKNGTTRCCSSRRSLANSALLRTVRKSRNNWCGIWLHRSSKLPLICSRMPF